MRQSEGESEVMRATVVRAQCGAESLSVKSVVRKYLKPLNALLYSKFYKVLCNEAKAKIYYIRANERDYLYIICALKELSFQKLMQSKLNFG